MQILVRRPGQIAGEWIGVREFAELVEEILVAENLERQKETMSKIEAEALGAGAGQTALPPETAGPLPTFSEIDPPK